MNPEFDSSPDHPENKRDIADTLPGSQASKQALLDKATAVTEHGVQAAGFKITSKLLASGSRINIQRYPDDGRDDHLLGIISVHEPQPITAGAGESYVSTAYEIKQAPDGIEVAKYVSSHGEFVGDAPKSDAIMYVAPGTQLPRPETPDRAMQRELGMTFTSEAEVKRLLVDLAAEPAPDK